MSPTVLTLSTLVEISNTSTRESIVSLDNRWSNLYHRLQIKGRLSSMTKQIQPRTGLLQGTLDMLILRTLLYGPAHGHQIGKQCPPAVPRPSSPCKRCERSNTYPVVPGKTPSKATES